MNCPQREFMEAHYQQNACLQSNEIYSLAVDQKGHVWAGTRGGGVSVWDGFRWTTYEPPNGPTSTTIGALIITSHGHVWSAAREGVYIWDGHHWFLSPTEEYASDGYPKALTADAEGRMWAASEWSVNYWDGSRWRMVEQYDNHPSDISSIASDGRGNIWVGGYEDGIHVWDGSAWSTTNDGLADERVTTLRLGPDGHIWAGTRSGVSVWDGRSWSSHLGTGAPSDTVWDIAFASDGAVWIGGDGRALHLLANGEWTDVELPLHMNYLGIRAIAIGPDGRVWVGTGSGIGVWDGQTWVTYGTEESLDASVVHAMMRDSVGRIWAGTTTGLCMWDGVRWRAQTKADGLSDEWVMSVAELPSGRIWVGTWSGGVNVVGGGSWTVHSTSEGLASDRVPALLAADESTIWAGTDNGLQKWDGAKWWGCGPRDIAVLCLVEDAMRRVWAGTYGLGIWVWNGDEWRAHRVEDGLSDDRIRCLACDNKGGIWAGTETGRVYVWDGTRWESHTPMDGLRGGRINAIAVDGNDHVWIGTEEDGIWMWNGREWTSRKPSTYLLSQRIEALLCLPDGRLWAGTWDGIRILKWRDADGGQTVDLREALPEGADRLHFERQPKSERRLPRVFPASDAIVSCAWSLSNAESSFVSDHDGAATMFRLGIGQAEEKLERVRSQAAELGDEASQLEQRARNGIAKARADCGWGVGYANTSMPPQAAGANVSDPYEALKAANRSISRMAAIYKGGVAAVKQQRAAANNWKIILFVGAPLAICVVLQILGSLVSN